MNVALASLSFLLCFSPALTMAAVGLAYQAPGGCPTQPEFIAAVATRGADFGDAPQRGADRTMVVSIHKQDAGFVGSLQVRDDHVTTDKREVHGPNCGEVVDALAVVTAIELRPAPPPMTKEPSEAPPNLRLRGSTRAFPPRSETVQVGAGSLRFDLQRSVTAYAGATVGMIPSVLLPRFDLSFVGANFVTTPEGVQRIAGPVTQLRVSFLGPANYQSTGTVTDVNGLSFGIGLCQSPLYDSRGLSLLICGEYGGGIMRLRTKDTDGVQIQSKTTGFGTVNFGTELQYNLASWLHIGAKLGGGFTVGQLTAERADGSRIFGSSIWSAYALLGAGVPF